MVSSKLSQIYKQYPCSFLFVFVETRYYQHNYCKYYCPFITETFILICLLMRFYPEIHSFLGIKVSVNEIYVRNSKFNVFITPIYKFNENVIKTKRTLND